MKLPHYIKVEAKKQSLKKTIEKGTQRRLFLLFRKLHDLSVQGKVAYVTYFTLVICIYYIPIISCR